MKSITIYTDGACEGNPGPGGWAAVLLWNGRTKEISGGEPATTNNRMELQAAIGALAILKEKCEIEFFTDSEYLRKGITEWLRGWKARNWLTKEKQPVKNEALWRELDRVQNGHKINWRWVKGHAGNHYNERCDLLAREAVISLRKQYPPAQLKELLKAYKTQDNEKRAASSML